MSEEKRCIKCGRKLTEDESKFAFPRCTDCFRYERMIEEEPESFDECYYDYEMDDEM